MMNARNTLHPALKFDTGRVRAGEGFQVFCGAEFGKHLPTYAASFHACRYPSWF
ncbi:hypothetical protein AZ037_003754, partial [Klebsiella michiganensis]